MEVPLYYQESIDSENASLFPRQHSIPTLRFKLDQPVIYCVRNCYVNLVVFPDSN